MSALKRPGLRNPKSILKAPSNFPVRADAPLASDLPPFVPPLETTLQASQSTPTTANSTGFGAPPPVTPHQQARNRQIALQHAKVLQQRKNTEALVLANLEELMDFPASPSSRHSAANPSAADLARFQQLISPFNTADYDELLTERNCADRCAYVFCPSMLSRDRSARANINRLHYNGSKIVSVKQSKLDQWCCKACARRALYIKVQLSESPAWERAAESSGTIELLREGDDLVLEEKMKGLNLGGGGGGGGAGGAQTAEQQAKRDADLLQAAMEELALERGDTRTDSARRAAVMKDVLVEKATVTRPTAPSGSSTGEAIEGHVPRVQKTGRRVTNNNNSETDDDDDAEEEEEDTDWAL